MPREVTLQRMLRTSSIQLGERLEFRRRRQIELLRTEDRSVRTVVNTLTVHNKIQLYAVSQANIIGSSR